MKCRKCGKDQDRVIDTRPRAGGLQTRRRRECLACGWRWTTVEIETRLRRVLDRKLAEDHKLERSPE